MEKDKIHPTTSNRRKRKLLSGSKEPQVPEPLEINHPTYSNIRKKRLLSGSNELEVPKPQQQPEPLQLEQRQTEFEDQQTNNDEKVEQEAGEDGGSSSYDDDDEDDGEGEGEEEPENSKIASPRLLKGFQTHVAKFIYQGTERGVLKCHSHVAKLKAWKMDDAKDKRDLSKFQSYFNSSKIMKIRQAAYKNPNKNLISAFVERWHPETNSFHLPFGEMTITLDDVYCLTDLPVDGLPVQSTREEKKKGKEDVMELLGRTEKDATLAVGGASGSSVKLQWLRDTFAPLMDSSDEKDVLYAARAYVLYTFGTTLFADKSGTRVSCSWLQYTEDMLKFGQYAWGAATLAYLYRQLGLASQFKVKQIGGFLTLLEAWIYEHFPHLILPPRNPNFQCPQPLAAQYSPEAHTSPSIDRVRGFRETLDVFLGSKVRWTPYAVLRRTYPLQKVTYFHGCLVCGNIVELYMPDRVLRQYGYVQKIPDDPLDLNVGCGVSKGKGKKRSRSRSKRTRLVFGGMANLFSSWDSHILTQERLGNEVIHHWDCVDGYMDWFLSNCYPVVSNPSIVRLTERESARSIEPWERNESAKVELQNLVDEWRSGEALTLEEAMKVVLHTITTLRGPEQTGPSSREDSGWSRVITGSQGRGRGGG